MTNIADRYLKSMVSVKSRVSMGSYLNVAANFFSPGSTRNEFNWAALRYHQLHDLRDHLNNAGRAPNTINSYLAAIKGVCKEAWRLKLMDVDDHMRIQDVKRVKGSRTVKGRALDAKELNTLLDHCLANEGIVAMRDAAMIALSYGAGLRREEAIKLDLERYTPPTKTEIGEICVLGKGNKERTLPLHRRVSDILECWLDERGRDPGPLFVRLYKGGKTKLERLSDQTVYDVIVRRYKEAGLKKMTPHDLRRTFGTNLFQAGEADHVIQEMMGHSDPSTTQIYNMDDSKGKKLSAVKALPL